ncbi:hypothetical protein BCV70DRAFT_199723 [Testicularia cyperi]|uniref:MFS general substrate transporter n=1 Tax=Testicularia cyperi TaxID=1882483 RepID=A0A317XQ59_9BASI|nr:hypothetical protein BCV70DRAFT_199723 [Testicularia cyperi]
MSAKSSSLASASDPSSQSLPSTSPSASNSHHLRQRSAAPKLNGTISSEAVEQSDMLSTRTRSAKALEDPTDMQEMGLQQRNADNKETKDAASTAAEEAQGFMDLSPTDRKAMILLVILYLLQGVPVGLAFGTMPFLLKSKLSYGDIGFFMLCTYPYSLKLFWSPIVDSCFVNQVRLPLIGTVSLGRRKSWIVPIQTIVGLMFWYLSRNVDQLLLADIPNVSLITFIFFVLILFAATQDIAVDGWALTLLSQENLSYASTAQTVGLNSGYFLSFTVFLAFNSVEFSNKYFRSTPLEYPLLSLSAYMRFWAFGFIAVTAWLALFKKEDEEEADAPDMDVKKVYSIMWRICQLKHVQTFILIHLVAKIGFQANEAVTGLKLVEKGFGKEDLALAVLIDFPFQLIFGYLAARWSKGDKALQPWVVAFFFRLGFAVLSMAIVKAIPSPVGSGFFFLVIASTVAGSFASTVQFVGISAFHTQIADPLIGGTYMTLLNTVSNLGGTWPRYFVLKAVDLFTLSSCQPPASATLLSDPEIAKLWATASKGIGGNECTSDMGKAACSAAGGSCIIERDGYFWTSTLCVVVGTITLVTFIIPACRKLQALPASAWRVNLHSNSKSH